MTEKAVLFRHFRCRYELSRAIVIAWNLYELGRKTMRPTTTTGTVRSTMPVHLATIAGALFLAHSSAIAQGGPAHPNPNADADMETVANRGDIIHLPAPLKNALVRMAARPHTYLAMQAYAEADRPSQLFQYYLIDTH